MSRVYFHAEDGSAELRGSERAYASCLCNDLFTSAMGLTGYVSDERAAGYLTLFPPTHYLRNGGANPGFTARNIATAMATGPEFFYATLNTAYVMGSDTVKLLARLHGQCEIHAYVEGRDRSWLASLIENGRDTKVLRADMGWESVVALLRSDDRGPVVTSYSVCEQFPNRHIAGNWSGDEDAWYRLPADETWRHAIDGLYASGDGLQLQPDGWEDFYFGDGTTAFDLLDTMRAATDAAAGSVVLAVDPSWSTPNKAGTP